MLKIFARHGTSEKVMVLCFTKKQIAIMQKALNIKYGGNWVPVDEFKPQQEVFKFDDNLLYLGYTGKSKRYVSGTIPLFNNEKDGNS